MISHTRSHALRKDVSVYTKLVIETRLDTVRCSRQNSRSPIREDEAEILTTREVVFKHYAIASKYHTYGLGRHHTFSYALGCPQLVSLELCLDTSGLMSMDIYVFAQHQPFSSSFAYARNKISNTMSAYTQHYSITSTGSRQKSICHRTRRNRPSMRQ